MSYNKINECCNNGYEIVGAIRESYIDGVSHMYSIVEINDMKYDIHGIYNFDDSHYCYMVSDRSNDACGT